MLRVLYWSTDFRMPSGADVLSSWCAQQCVQVIHFWVIPWLLTIPVVPGVQCSGPFDKLVSKIAENVLSALQNPQEALLGRPEAAS